MAMTWSENGSKTQNVLLTVATYGDGGTVQPEWTENEYFQ